MNATYNTGDRGGNDEVLPNICGVNNLHGVWDSISYNYCEKLTMPLSKETWDWFTLQTFEMASEYPVDAQIA